MYWLANKDSKRVIIEAKYKVYNIFYGRLSSMKGEKSIYMLTKARERKIKDLVSVKYV